MAFSGLKNKVWDVNSVIDFNLKYAGKRVGTIAKKDKAFIMDMIRDGKLLSDAVLKLANIKRVIRDKKVSGDELFIKSEKATLQPDLSDVGVQSNQDEEQPISEPQSNSAADDLILSDGYEAPIESDDSNGKNTVNPNEEEFVCFASEIDEIEYDADGNPIKLESKQVKKSSNKFFGKKKKKQ